MVETLTPAGCGGRQRQLLAIALFSVGSIAASAVVGAALGLLGSALPMTPLLVAVAVLAAASAAGEAGIVRRRLPTVRRQVPESWRRRWPLPAWSSAYGVGLGLGFLTHQVTAAYWVAAAGALALGDPLLSALAFGAFGVGRAVMAAWPALSRDPALAVGGLAERRRAVGPANALALAALALALSASVAVAQTEPTGRFDPSMSGRILAHATRDAAGNESVQVRNPAGALLTSIPGARSPSVDGRRIAVETDRGIDVLEWTTGRRLARVSGRVGEPALDWPRLVYVRRGPRAKRLILRNLLSGARRALTSVSPSADLGRPALDGQRVAWHHAAGRSNLLFVRGLSRTARTQVVASSRTAVHVNPSLNGSRILWVESRASTSIIWTRRLDRPGSGTRRVGAIRGPSILWTTAVQGRRAVVTRWSTRSARARLVSRRL